MSDQEEIETLRDRIGEEAYQVTQHGSTEAPFAGKYYKNKDDGMYHCIVCGAKLFNSDTKFDSQSGWPSFYDVVNDDTVSLIPDDSEGMSRTEVKCKECNSHLGHVFRDAPETPTGQRFCINSCALSFEENEKDSN